MSDAMDDLIAFIEPENKPVSYPRIDKIPMVHPVYAIQEHDIKRWAYAFRNQRDLLEECERAIEQLGQHIIDWQEDEALSLEQIILDKNARIRELEAELALHKTARPLDEWHEDYGPVTWWKFPVGEASWIGTPNDSDWPFSYYTHWTPHPPIPNA